MNISRIIASICIPAVAVLLINAACGYHLNSSVQQLPAGIHSLGVPTFKNLTKQYKLEQQISGEVLKEFAVRTRIPVNSNSSNVDALLLGEILGMDAAPVAFASGQNTFGSAFMVTVRLSAKLVSLKDSKVIWQNDDYIYRERYILNSNVRDFFSENNPALDRLAREFAAGLVSTLLNGSTP